MRSITSSLISFFSPAENLNLNLHNVAEFGKVSSKGYAADWSDLKVKSLA